MGCFNSICGCRRDAILGSKRELDAESSADSKRRRTGSSTSRALTWSDRSAEVQQQGVRHDDLGGRESGEVVRSGKVKRLMDRVPPFGFILPDGGGGDLYFNEGLLGSGHTWAELLQQVAQSEHGSVPVLFVLSTGGGGKPQAKGVVLLTGNQRLDLDSDGDGNVSDLELSSFLRKHPDIKASALLSKRDQEYQHRKDENEAETQRRGKLFDKQDAAEDALYAKRDNENAKAAALRARAQELWESGKHQEAKDLQAQAKDCVNQAHAYKQQAVDLDWKNNEDMYAYVMANEHDGRTQDGTWLDLHGLSADFSCYKVREVLVAARKAGITSVEIITGAGNHSGAGGPKVKQRVQALLRRPSADLGDISFVEENHGALIVKLS